MQNNDNTGQERDATQAFLESLPELKPGESFRFACHPKVPCFNACCSDLALMLTPYDVLRLRSRLMLSSRDFIARHAETALAPDTGFPMLRLRMMDSVPGSPCPFVTREGCSVYPDRPGACRTYPLGRATKTGASGEVVEQFFVVREPHCRGFEEDARWSSGEWLKDQDLKEYNRHNDRHMLLLARAKDLGARLDQRQANMVFLAAYNLDGFMRFLSDTGMMDRLEMGAHDREAVERDETRRLEFAMDWLDMILFGRTEALRRKS